MKKLTLIRHAKSSWKHAGLSDGDRPLNKRGRKDAPMMGARLARRGFSPQRLVSSSALRALRTAQAIAATIELPPDHIQIDPRIYGADTVELMALIQSFSPHDQWIAIVGHNPAMTILANRLSGEFIDNIPTCGIVEMHYDVNRWDQLGDVEVIPSFYSFDYPKNLPD